MTGPRLEDDIRAALQYRARRAPTREPRATPTTVAGGRRTGAPVVVGLAVASIAFVGTVVAANVDRDPRVIASAPPLGEGRGRGDKTGPYTCAAQPPLDIGVPGASDGALIGTAPGARVAEPGQRVVHWTTTVGSVEVRWPATPPPLYGDTSRLSTLHASEMATPTQTAIDVDPPRQDLNRPPTQADVVIRTAASTRIADPPCDLLELTVVTGDGRWVTGLKATPPSTAPPGSQLPYEVVDLQPRIIERRAVSSAPRTAVRCQGSDQFGTPPNRSGGPDLSLRSLQPSDVLVGYLSTRPGAPARGYVEMTEPDGSITYGVDPSGIGWTTLVFVARDHEGWYLKGWTASGC